jgi:hypothetical protein
MRTPSTILLLAALLVCGCGKRRTAEVAEVTKASVVTLTAPADRRLVHGISLRFRGHLDGMAIVSGTNIQTQRLTGDFDVSTGGDWYSTNCVLQYSPESVRSGTVTIEYDFRGSK